MVTLVGHEDALCRVYNVYLLLHGLVVAAASICDFMVIFDVLDCLDIHWWLTPVMIELFIVSSAKTSKS